MRSWIAMATLVVTACGGSPTSPSGEAANFSWTVDGASFQASSNGRGAGYYAGALSIIGADCSRGAILDIQLGQANAAAGIYNISGGILNVTWTPDARTGSAASVSWRAGQPFGTRGSGSGSLTVDEISGSWIRGSFTFQMLPDSSSQPDQSTKTAQGSFSLPIREVKFC